MVRQPLTTNPFPYSTVLPSLPLSLLNPTQPNQTQLNPTQTPTLNKTEILNQTKKTTEDIQWSCTAPLPPTLRLDATDVICEGYASSSDPYVLRGSCGVEYTLQLTEEGRRRHPDLYKKTKEGDWAGYLFGVVFVAVLGWIIWSACVQARGNGGNNNGGGGGGGRRGWGGGGGGGGWGPGWGGGGGGGGGGGNGWDDPPPPYPGSGGRPGPKASSSASASGEQGWRPGFWSGLAGGAAAGYMAGSRGQRNNERNYGRGWGNDGGSSWGSGSGSGWGSSGRSSSSGSSGSGARYESTGYGTTSRR